MFSVRQHDTRTLKWWSSHRDEIELDPPYQRKGKVWPNAQRAYLIDSILNEYDIPKIYLADFTIVNTELNSAKKPYAVIDGRQRLEAIFGFLRNEFPLNSDVVFFKETTLELGGLYYRDLQQKYPDIASRVEEFNLHVMSVMTDDEARINDLFVRLNTSRPLTGAEVRNAMQGEVPEAIRRIVHHAFFVEHIAFSTKRGQDKNTAAKLLLIEFRGKLVDTKKTHLDRFVKEGQKSETIDIERAATRTLSGLDKMCRVFVERDSLLSSQGAVSVYYWLIRLIGPVPGLREFLVRFEEARKRNRNTAKSEPMKADQELLNYDILNRSTNDQGSLQGRLDILVRRFRDSETAKQSAR